MIENKPAKEC